MVDLCKQNDRAMEAPVGKCITRFSIRLDMQGDTRSQRIFALERRIMA